MSHFMCEHGIDLSGAPCHICENTPEWDWMGKLKKEGWKVGDAADFLNLTEEEKKAVEDRLKKHKKK